MTDQAAWTFASVEKANALFREGYSCSQAVLAAFADLPPDLSLRLAAGFGAGMGRMGEVCGAVSGAVMALGLKYGHTHAQDTAAKETTYRRVGELVQRFKARNGSLLCRELLGCELDTPEGLQAARQAGLFSTVCPGLVQDAADILASILESD